MKCGGICAILTNTFGKQFPESEVILTEKKGIKIAAQNRKAYHDYFVEDKYEAGIELCGTEVKSIRAGSMNLKDSYCTVKDGELFVHSMHISPYEHGNIFNRDPDRDRRLLMHKREQLSFGVTARLERHSTSGGGKYKGILQQLMMERDYAYKRQIRYFVNEDIDKFMRRLS